MNTDGCPMGWATDEVFIYGGAPARCEMPVPAWITLGTIIVIGKAFVVFKHVTLWVERYRKMKVGVQHYDRRTALPIIPSLGVMSFIIYFLFFLTTSLNVSNSANGWAGGLYSLGWFIFGTMSILYFLKMLRLGKKLIPLSKKINVIDATTMDRIRDEELGKFDSLGRILFTIEVMAVLSQWILFFIVGVFVSHSFDIAIAGFAVMGLFLFVHPLSVMWLVERTITAIKKSQFKSDSNSSTADGPMRNDIKNIIRKMREQQLVILLLGIGGSLIYILVVSQLVPTAWYVILIHMYSDLAANLIVVFSMGRRAAKEKVSQMKSPKRSERNAAALVGGDTTTTANRRTFERKTDAVATDVGYHSVVQTNVYETNKDDNKGEHFMVIFQSQNPVEDDDD